MLDLRGKILILAFFTLSGFTCYRETTLFDEFTIVAASNQDYPNGYYRIIIGTDNERYTSFNVPCGKTEEFHLKYNTTYGNEKWLDRNECIAYNQYLQSETTIFEINSRPFLDLLQLHFNSPGIYKLVLNSDSCSLYGIGNDPWGNKTLEVKADTTITMGVIPDSSQYLRIELQGSPIFENRIKTGRIPIDIDL